MSKENQIDKQAVEEMARVIEQKCNRDCIPSCDECIAQTLYNAGYRKQSVGEWVTLDECANEGVYCSACHKKVYKKDYANVKARSPYCPNCGAKMKGGAE